jgi:hypothetical protein
MGLRPPGEIDLVRLPVSQAGFALGHGISRKDESFITQTMVADDNAGEQSQDRL